MTLLPPPPGTTPAYGGCTCSCHRSPGVVHCVPCCAPPPAANTVAGIVAELIETMPQADKDAILAAKSSVHLHNSLGRMLRNVYQLWHREGLDIRKDAANYFTGDAVEIDSPNRDGRGITHIQGVLHPDCVSDIIIQQLRVRLAAEAPADLHAIEPSVGDVIESLGAPPANDNPEGPQG